jgi:hypothetical protein
VSIKNVASEKTRLQLTLIMKSRPWMCSDQHFTTCRFCEKSGYHKAWKYGVRHYACQECAEGIVAGPFGVYKKRCSDASPKVSA